MSPWSAAAAIVPSGGDGYRGAMGRKIYPLVSLFALLLLAACERGPEPYVFIKNEFDRDREDFGREPEDRTDVQICYNSRSTTPEAVRQMAVDECGKYSKQAVFTHHEYLQCPLLLPARAHFDCRRP